jgi:hypothetical protein
VINTQPHSHPSLTTHTPTHPHRVYYQAVLKVELGTVQRYIASTVASLAGVPEDVGVDQLSVKDAVTVMDRILPVNSTTRVLLFGVTPVKEGGRPPTITALPSAAHIPSQGSCIYAVKVTKKAIGTSTMAEELFFGKLPLDGSDSALIKAFNFAFAHHFTPMVRGNGEWGQMVSEDASRERLFSTMDGLATTLKNAATAVDTQVRLFSQRVAALHTPRSALIRCSFVFTGQCSATRMNS